VKGEVVSALADALPQAARDEIAREVSNQWEAMRANLIDHFSCAAEAYFRFLEVSSSSSDGDLSSRLSLATLRLLRLLVVYGSQLSAVFTAHLTSCPTSPWLPVLPQLFARVGTHKDPFVTEQVHSHTAHILCTCWSV
jgi:hypothetical protein